VSRFCLAFLVTLLAFSASGVSALIVAEPCAGYDQSGREDGECPPTCVTCGCCNQAAEPVILAVTVSLEIPLAQPAALLPRPPKVQPRDILHVPKTGVA
jgi:hypothetical protein